MLKHLLSYHNFVKMYKKLYKGQKINFKKNEIKLIYRRIMLMVDENLNQTYEIFTKIAYKM